LELTDLSIHETQAQDTQTKTSLNKPKVGTTSQKSGGNVKSQDDTPISSELNLEGFTASPKADDVLLYALPFCGPLSSMMNFKYRVKLTPGKLKKGKASKTAVELFTRAQGKSSLEKREKGLIKSVTDPNNVTVMVGGVKISAPGVAQATKSLKKGKGNKASNKKQPQQDKKKNKRSKNKAK